MTSLSADTITKLNLMAAEITESWDERNYRIDLALDADRVFRRTNRPRSAMTLEMLSDAYRVAASRVGVDCAAGTGGAQELRVEAGGRIAVIRLRKAEQRGEDIFIAANKGSTWGGIDEDALVEELPFVYGYMIDARSGLELFVAEVTDVIEGAPGQLVLGPATFLGGEPRTPQAEFVSDDDESLPGFDDDETGDAEQRQA